MIFDASSIYRAVEIDAIEKLENGKTISLAIYELGNAVRKEVIRKNLSSEEGIKLLDFLSQLFSVLDILETGIDTNTLKISLDENLSYYDASYLQAAIFSGDLLVTEDNKLLKSAVRYVEACKLENL